MNNSEKQKASPIGNSSGRGEGLSSVKTTLAFRAFNFELYTKPNKYVMGFGLIAITGCVAYLAYLNATAENRTEQQIYQVYDTEGSVITTQRKKTKWD